LLLEILTNPQPASPRRIRAWRHCQTNGLAEYPRLRSRAVQLFRNRRTALSLCFFV